MKFKLSTTAFTLIELIVSLVLVSIVLLGIVSISTVLNNNNQDYGQRYLVKADTQTTLNHILNNASLAIGSGTTVNGYSDQGIVMGNDAALGWGDANSFCIHQGPNNNIINSAAASGIWLCYTWYPAAGIKPYQIYYCTQTYNTTQVTRGANSCVAASPNFTFLGSAFSWAPSFVDSQTLNELQFSITLQNCLDDTATSCQAGGTSTDPVNNPEVQLSASITPPQEGI